MNDAAPAPAANDVHKNRQVASAAYQIKLRILTMDSSAPMFQKQAGPYKWTCLRPRMQKSLVCDGKIFHTDEVSLHNLHFNGPFQLKLGESVSSSSICSAEEVLKMCHIFYGPDDLPVTKTTL